MLPEMDLSHQEKRNTYWTDCEASVVSYSLKYILIIVTVPTCVIPKKITAALCVAPHSVNIDVIHQQISEELCYFNLLYILHRVQNPNNLQF